MTALQQLYEALAPLRLYALHSGSLVDAELTAYGAGFALVQQQMAATLHRAFVQTATGGALAQHEKLVGLPPRAGMDDPSRRALVLYRLGVAPFDFSREGMLNSIRATGMEAELLEQPQQESLVIQCKGLLDRALELDSLKARVRTVLPAHLLCEFDIGELTWDLFESAGADWNAWDAKNMTWVEFDIRGHEIFLQEGSPIAQQ